MTVSLPPVIDAHQHFWDPGKTEYPWMTADSPLYRRFGPEDLKPLLDAEHVDYSIVVQARGGTDETLELMQTATRVDFVAGVVGWVDLTMPTVGDVIDQLLDRTTRKSLVGFRHQVEDEVDPQWLASINVRRGLAAIQQRGLTYDLLVTEAQLPAAIETVRALPELRFVVDHAAKPSVRQGTFEPWESRLRELASAPNVWCKVSGLLTEADHASWTTNQLVPFLDRVLDMFEIERLLYGSDWPVCLLAASYHDTLQATLQAMPRLSEAELSLFMGGNAVTAYQLPLPGGRL